MGPAETHRADELGPAGACSAKSRASPTISDRKIGFAVGFRHEWLEEWRRVAKTISRQSHWLVIAQRRGRSALLRSGPYITLFTTSFAVTHLFNATSHGRCGTGENGSLRLSVEMTLPARQQGATVDPTRGRKKRFFGCTCCGQPRRPVRIAHAHQLAPGTEIDDYIPDFPIGAVDADL
jgi:hypothetical protein